MGRPNDVPKRLKSKVFEMSLNGRKKPFMTPRCVLIEAHQLWLTNRNY